MDYSSARYFCIAFYSGAAEEEIGPYLSRMLEVGEGLSLRIEGIAYGTGLAIEKYRRQKYMRERLGEFVSRAKSERRQELGIYVTSSDYSSAEAPSLFANVQFAFSQTLGGKIIQEGPASFVIIAARVDTHEAKKLERASQSEIPILLRGGCWENRPYVLDGTAIEWAFKNYPVSRTACSLSQWNPKFDRVYA